jgi:hypothetical protein
MSKVVSISTLASSYIDSNTLDQRVEWEDRRNLVPKSPKIQQILNDYWIPEKDRRKVAPDSRKEKLA